MTEKIEFKVMYNEDDLAAYVVDEAQPGRLYLPDGREWVDARRDRNDDIEFMVFFEPDEWELALATASYLQSMSFIRLRERSRMAGMTKDAIAAYVTSLFTSLGNNSAPPASYRPVGVSHNQFERMRERERLTTLVYQAAFVEQMRWLSANTTCKREGGDHEG